MKFLVFMCAFAQMVYAQSGSTATLQLGKKSDFHRTVATGGTSPVMGKKLDCALRADTGGTSAGQGQSKKKDFAYIAKTGGGSVVIGGGKKSDIAFSSMPCNGIGEPIIISGNGKKKDFSSLSRFTPTGSDTGGGSTVVGSTQNPLSKKNDYAMADTGGNGTIISSGGKKQDFKFRFIDTGGRGDLPASGGKKHDFC